MPKLSFSSKKNGKVSVLSDESRAEIRRCYSVLRSLEKSVEGRSVSVPVKWVRLYEKCLRIIFNATGDKAVSSYKIEESTVPDYRIGPSYRGLPGQMITVNVRGYKPTTMANTIRGLMGYMKEKYIDSFIFNKESLLSMIGNELLRERCVDLLTSKSAFDRAVNQATQVLEDQIKKRAKLQRTRLIGKELVQKAISPDINATILLFSKEASVQEAFSFLYKGAVLAYRNPTHHSTDFCCTKEDALKCCVFIDSLLDELLRCKVQRPKKAKESVD